MGWTKREQLIDEIATEAWAIKNAKRNLEKLEFERLLTQNKIQKMERRLARLLKKRDAL